MSILQRSKYFSNSDILNYSNKTIFQSTSALTDLPKWRYVDKNGLVEKNRRGSENLYVSCDTFKYSTDLNFSGIEITRENICTLLEKIDYIFSLKIIQEAFHSKDYDKDPNASRRFCDFFNILSSKSTNIRNLTTDLFIYTCLIDLVKFPNIENITIQHPKLCATCSRKNIHDFYSGVVNPNQYLLNFLKNNFGLGMSTRHLLLKNFFIDVELICDNSEFNLDIDLFPNIENIILPKNSTLTIYSSSGIKINHSLKKIDAVINLKSDILFSSVVSDSFKFHPDSLYNFNSFPNCNKFFSRHLDEIKNIPDVLLFIKELTFSGKIPKREYILDEMFPNIEKIIYETFPPIVREFNIFFQEINPKINVHKTVKNILFVDIETLQIPIDLYFLKNFSFPSLRVAYFYLYYSCSTYDFEKIIRSQLPMGIRVGINEYADRTDRYASKYRSRNYIGEKIFMT